MTKIKTVNSSSGKIVLLVLVCFFLSGLTGLIYEILWTRMIVKIIGTAPFAVSIILTVFMAGLGLGSYIASRTIDRIKDHLRLVRIYGILELIVGGYCLVLPLLLKGFLPIYSVVYNHLFKHFMVYNLLTFVGCSVLLLIPVTCMGATLPVLCRFYVSRLSHLGTHAGRLYGLNTIGAAAGALVCGFWLIALLGVYGTLGLAVILNAAIGFVSIAASYKWKLPIIAQTTEPSEETVSEQLGKPAYKGVTTAALIIFAVSGFCAMAYEVIWTKLLGLLIGPTTYSFTIVLVTFITVLALGSIVFGWLADRVKSPINLLIYTQILAGVFALFVSHILGNSQFFFAKLIYNFQNNFALLHVLKAGTLFLFMFFPTFCLGATFPLVGKIYTRSLSNVGGSIGFAYAINTIGAVLGSFCAGFLLIPFLGKENGLRLVTGVQMLTAMVLAAYLLLANKQNKLRVVPIGALVVLGLVLCAHFPSWNRHLLAMGKYQRFDRIRVNLRRHNWFQALLHGPEILAKSERSELAYYADGIGGFTTVLKYTDPFGTIDYSMANSGKPDASSRADMKTQTLLAHFPMLFHRDPKTVMVLGLASGITAGETLHYPIDRLDVLEISPEVVIASKFFAPWNNDVLSNPKTSLIIQDGRAHLQLTKQKYDVVVSEPSNPWMAGLATLFTSDFFSLVKDRLNENGIFCQWVHSYQMDWPTFAMIGRTFAGVFANSLLVSTAPSVDGHDFLLVGFNGIDRLTLLNAERNLPCVQQSSNITLRDPRLLYRLVLSQNLRKLFGTGPVNTDSSPSLEFNAPKLMYLSDPNIPAGIKSAKSLEPETADIIRHIAADVDSQIDFAAFALSVYSPFLNMVDLSRATMLQTEQFFAFMEGYCAKNPLDYAVLKNTDLKRRCLEIQSGIVRRNIDLVADKALSYLCLAQLYEQNNMPAETIANYLTYLEIVPDDAIVQHNLALLLGNQDRLDEAIHHYMQALKIDPYNAVTHSNLGVLLTRKQRLPEAISHFNESLRLKPDFADAHSNLGYVLGRQGKLDEAVKHITEALRINPKFAEAHYNLGFILSRKGDLDRAIIHFKETLRIDPNFVKAREGLEKAMLQKSTTEQTSPAPPTDNPLQP